MANSISSEITISTAIDTLQNMLAPLSEFTLNITSDIVGRQANVKVPIIDTDDVARPYDSTNGYTLSSDTDVSSVTVALNEQIKPFHLNDNDMNKSPLTIANYARQNANEFGRYLMSLIFAEIDANITSGAIPSGNEISVPASSVAIANIKSVHSKLDQVSSNMNRHMILSAGASNNLLPSSIETFGNSVVASGRFQQLYGMNLSVHNQSAGAGECHSFACPNDAIVVANRVPDVSGTATLEEFTPFTVEGLGLQCAYRRFYDASKGIHYGAFTTIFGTKVAKGSQVVALTE
jgi:hypothetical protein